VNGAVNDANRLPNTYDSAVLSSNLVNGDCIIYMPSPLDIAIVQFEGSNRIALLTSPTFEFTLGPSKVGMLTVKMAKNSGIWVDSPHFDLEVIANITIESGELVWKSRSIYCRNSGIDCLVAPSCTMTISGSGQASFLAEYNFGTNPHNLCLNVLLQKESELRMSKIRGPGSYAIAGILKNEGKMTISDIGLIDEISGLAATFSRWENYGVLIFASWKMQSIWDNYLKFFEKSGSYENQEQIAFDFPVDNKGNGKIIVDTTFSVTLGNGGQGSGTFQVYANCELKLLGRYDFTSSAKFVGGHGQVWIHGVHNPWRSERYSSEGCGFVTPTSPDKRCGRLVFEPRPTTTGPTKDLLRFAGKCEGGLNAEVTGDVQFVGRFILHDTCGLFLSKRKNARPLLQGRSFKDTNDKEDYDVWIQPGINICMCYFNLKPETINRVLGCGDLIWYVDMYRHTCMYVCV